MAPSARRLVPALFRAYSSIGARAGETAVPVSNAHRTNQGVIQVPSRLLMGPGPANAAPRVLAAQSLPLLGHLHPPFLKIMDEIQQGLRYAFQTDSKYTCLISSTGHGGMEAAVANLAEPGETMLVGNKGIWGARVADMAGRFGANVVELKAGAGETFSREELEAALAKHKPAVLFLCQGESSTGTHQSLAGLGEACRRTNTLLLVDTVCSLGGVPMFADAWGVDCIYSGSQKVLAAPPGVAPFFLSERALAKIRARKTVPRTFALDLNLIGDYWGWFGGRSYHHTAAVSTYYAMREALQIVVEEGLEPMWARHAACHAQLWTGLGALGLEPFVKKEQDRLITVNTISVPEGVDFARLIKHAMDRYSLEIAGGLGPSAGKVWRVGIMGHNAQPQNIALVVKAFETGLAEQGWQRKKQ